MIFLSNVFFSAFVCGTFINAGPAKKILEAKSCSDGISDRLNHETDRNEMKRLIISNDFISISTLKISEFKSLIRIDA